MDSNDRIPDTPYWYALYTKPRSEFKAAAQLEAIDVVNYLPLFESVKQWSDRKKKVTEPLLKGYIFIHTAEKQRLLALQQSSIVRCISDKGKPARIPDWQIENLKIMLNSRSGIAVREGIFPGDTVQILEGPFKGIIGKIISGENERMIAVSVDLLNRSVVAHLPIDSSLKIITRSSS